MKRIVRAECAASDSPKEPVFQETTVVPCTVNDEVVTTQLEAAFRAAFGADYIKDAPGLGGSEDFANLAIPINKPYCYWTLGGIDRAKWDEAEKKGTIQVDIPTNHSPFFAPEVEPTLGSGVRALVAASVSFLGQV